MYSAVMSHSNNQGGTLINHIKEYTYSTIDLKLATNNTNTGWGLCNSNILVIGI